MVKRTNAEMIADDRRERRQMAATLRAPVRWERDGENGTEVSADGHLWRRAAAPFRGWYEREERDGWQRVPPGSSQVPVSVRKRLYPEEVV